MEIGSEFWIERDLEENISYKSQNWLNKYGEIVLTSSGRGAISLLLSELIKPRFKKVLLPSYLCESIILPFVKAEYEIIYYNVDEFFSICIEDIIKNSEVDIFFHMSYFGFATNNNLNEIISYLKSKSVIIFEDVTHSLFSSQVNQFDNDYVCGSIRKWFGVPGGGFLASKKNIDVELAEGGYEFINLRKSSLLLKKEYMQNNNKALKEKFLSGFNEAEKILDKDIKPYKIDDYSELIIKSIDSNYIYDNRRKNYMYLLENLKQIKAIKIIFSNIEEGFVPMFFPIYIKNHRDTLRKVLTEKMVYCPIHWSVPSQLEGKIDNANHIMYNSILSIPCDQRYKVEDMENIVTIIKNFFKE